MKVNENRIIRYLSAIAFADFTRFAETITDEDGSQCLVIKDTSQLTSSERCAISSMKVGTKGIEVKLYDRLKAIEMLARFTGAFNGCGDELGALRELFDSLDEEESA